MKRSALVLLMLVLSAPAIAQTAAFPDIPIDHWAAAAVQRLKDLGILGGFPDGQFHGDRTITRYEEAAALDRALAKAREWVAAIPAGPQGPPGPPGPQGSPGRDGRSVLTGAGAPDPALGADGDFYVNRTVWAIYGPKTSGSWGSGTSLIGPQGPPGSGAELGTIQGTVIGLPKLVVLKFAGGSANQVPITWGTCMTFYACREPINIFMNGASGDEMRIGSHVPFARVYFNLLTFGSGAAKVTEYYNGTSWVTVSGLNDGTAQFTRSGWLSFTVPSTWPKSSIESSEALHWLRVRSTGTWTSKPLAKLIGIPVADALIQFRGATVWTTNSNALGDYGPSPQLPVGAYVVDFSALGWVDIQYLVPVTPGVSTWTIGPQGR